MYGLVWRTARRTVSVPRCGALPCGPGCCLNRPRATVSWLHWHPRVTQPGHRASVCVFCAAVCLSRVLRVVQAGHGGRCGRPFFFFFFFQEKGYGRPGEPFDNAVVPVVNRAAAGGVVEILSRGTAIDSLLLFVCGYGGRREERGVLATREPNLHQGLDRGGCTAVRPTHMEGRLGPVGVGPWFQGAMGGAVAIPRTTFAIQLLHLPSPPLPSRMLHGGSLRGCSSSSSRQPQLARPGVRNARLVHMKPQQNAHPAAWDACRGSAPPAAHGVAAASRPSPAAPAHTAFGGLRPAHCCCPTPYAPSASGLAAVYRNRHDSGCCTSHPEAT